MKYTVFETFVGAGGSYLGFKNKGFKSIYVNDIDSNCLNTLLYNNPEIISENIYVDNSDIMDVDSKHIMKLLKLNPFDLDVLIGGIVCKGFSLAGEKSPNDKRNFYFLKQFDLINTIKPKISILENVPAILTAKIIDLNTPDDVKEKVNVLWKKIADYKGEKSKLRKTNNLSQDFENYGKYLRLEKQKMLEWLKEENYLVEVFDFIKKLYEKLGYNLYYSVLNSSWYGSATKRERAIIIGVRKDISLEFIFPTPTHMTDDLKNKYLANILKNSENDSFKKPLTVFEALNKIDYSIYDNDNIPMNHNKKTVERFKYIKPGTSVIDYLDDLPIDLLISNFYSRGNTMRLDGNLPSPTLVPGHSNFPIHPIHDRSITVREAAAITGFPLSYKFFGNHSKRCEQVGNAIPPNLSSALAQSCKDLLDKYYANKIKEDFSFDFEIDTEFLDNNLSLYINSLKNG